MEYPVGFDVAGATKTRYASDYTLQGISGRTVTYTVVKPVSAGGTLYGWYLHTDGIVNPAAAGTYSLKVSTSIDMTQVLVPVTIKAPGGGVTAASMTVSSLLSGTTTSHELRFIATSGLPAGATISVLYPPGFNVASATKTEFTSYYTLQGTSGQTITYNVVKPVSPGGTVYGWYLQTDGIVNPAAAGTYSVKVSTSSDPPQLSVPVTVTAAGAAVKSASVTASSPVTGATASYQLRLIATSGLPAGATISVQYPVEFNIAGATKTRYANKYSLQEISGQTIRYTVLDPVNAGGTLNASYLYTDGIVNPARPGAYTVKVSTSNDPVQVPVQVSITEPPRHAVALAFAGTGGGDVNGDMSCSKGSSCPPVAFVENTIVTLIPTNYSDSVFGGWSSECTVVDNNCQLTMDGPKNVAATFIHADKIRILAKPYSSLLAAFAESTSGLIRARAIEFVETVKITRPAAFKGGFDAEFSSSSGSYTVLKGKLTIGAGGTLRVQGLVIR
ncbi:MAG: hypothetical protein A2075_23480 [Geobacteraceae bacterium GWC2_58_44]|nr:MAG: hypothetical protein A2075_23480 [Geobacteraceae bacterium GWC2_58_44]HBG07592.1 hypothetical protein [Geobacter sp.]